MREYKRAWRAANPANVREAKKRWEAEHPEEHKAAKRRRWAARVETEKQQRRARVAANPEVFQEYGRRHREKIVATVGYSYYSHRITTAEKVEMLAGQGGGCAICAAEVEGRRAHIDHDHQCCPGGRSCGQCVRGILCAPCNQKLGWFEKHQATIEGYVDKLRVN